jgi:peptidoglycan/xylan/chitin deacetylase (PgdA/CDA1 family)
MGGVVCLTCDNMGSAADVGAGKLAGPDPDDISLTVGYPKWLQLLDGLGLSATFFIEGWNGLHHPGEVRALQDRGHEVALHGWVHERFAELSPLAAERVLKDALAAFRNIGVAPRGFRAPGGLRGAHTTSLLKQHHLEYDSSIDALGNAWIPPAVIDDGIVSIPWRLDAVDYFHFVSSSPPASPEAVERTWNGLMDHAAATGAVVTFIFHAMTIGAEDRRLAMAERVLRRAQADPRLEVLRADQLSRRIRADA